jgi:hypothetical protein
MRKAEKNDDAVVCAGCDATIAITEPIYCARCVVSEDEEDDEDDEDDEDTAVAGRQCAGCGEKVGARTFCEPCAEARGFKPQNDAAARATVRTVNAAIADVHRMFQSKGAGAQRRPLPQPRNAIEQQVARAAAYARGERGSVPPPTTEDELRIAQAFAKARREPAPMMATSQPKQSVAREGPKRAKPSALPQTAASPCTPAPALRAPKATRRAAPLAVKRRPPQEMSGPMETFDMARARLGLTANDYYRIELDHRGMVVSWAEYNAAGQQVRFRDPEVGGPKAKAL